MTELEFIQSIREVPDLQEALCEHLGLDGDELGAEGPGYVVADSLWIQPNSDGTYEIGLTWKQSLCEALSELWKEYHDTLK